MTLAKNGQISTQEDAALDFTSAFGGVVFVTCVHSFFHLALGELVLSSGYSCKVYGLFDFHVLHVHDECSIVYEDKKRPLRIDVSSI